LHIVILLKIFNYKIEETATENQDPR